MVLAQILLVLTVFKAGVELNKLGIVFEGISELDKVLFCVVV